MKINSRLKKIEREIQAQNKIPISDRFVPIGEGQLVQEFLGVENLEEENERRIQDHLKELREKYGEWVSREDLTFCVATFADDGKFPDKTEQ